MSKSNSKWILACSFLLVAAGFLLPLWPLSVVGILLAALTGRWLAALCLGILLDLAWGAPVGRLHIMYAPFTILAVVSVFVRWQLMHYIRPRPPDTL